MPITSCLAHHFRLSGEARHDRNHAVRACLLPKTEDEGKAKTHRRGSDALPRPADPAVLLGDVPQNVFRVPLLHLAEHVVHLACVRKGFVAKCCCATFRDELRQSIQVEGKIRAKKARTHSKGVREREDGLFFSQRLQNGRNQNVSGGALFYYSDRLTIYLL